MGAGGALAGRVLMVLLLPGPLIAGAVNHWIGIRVTGPENMLVQFLVFYGIVGLVFRKRPECAPRGGLKRA